MKLDVLAIGAHPDDVELGCGGTVALLAEQGRQVGILHLTRGERGTRGTAEERLAEAERAAAALGAADLAFLDCGDGGLRTGHAEEDALIEVLRAWRPEVVLGPTPHDRHPDHGRGHRLVEAACFYSGLVNRGVGGVGGAHRPAAVYSYMQHDLFEPSFVVDVTAVWDRKLAALRAYRSQLHQSDAAADERPGEPVTKVSTPEFSLMIEGRARHFGELIGAAFGEPFWSRGPLAVSDLFTILPGRGTVKIGISCYPTYGGSGIVATELAMALAAGGDEVHVISYALPSRLTLANSRLFFHEVIVPTYPLFEYPPYPLALATKMVEVARHSGLDVLHVHYAIPNAVSAVLARQILAPRPLPVVTTLHGTDVTLVGNDPSYLETTRFGILESDGVTAVSESLRQTTVEQLKIQKPIDVIPNFIDPARFDQMHGHPGARRWAKPGEKILVHISNFRPVKRVLDVVGIFARVLAQEPCRLLMVGDGPDRPKVEQYCRENGICGAITFVGSLPLIEEVLAGADLFLLPSETESFGLSALEALACEVPVVATRTGGLPEVVVEGECGHLLPVGDVDGMAAAALSLLRDDSRRRAFGAAGRRRAVEVFGQDAVVGRYRALYERVIEGRSATP